MKLLSFGASTRKTSINKQLASFTANLLEGAEVTTLDLNDYELPLFSADREKELGPQKLAKEFLTKIGESDGLVISFAEHNGSYTAAYKNLFDWCSRIEKQVFQNKPTLFLSTSPGPRGASSVLALALGSSKFFGADVKASLSVPSFNENFDLTSQTCSNHEIKAQLLEAVQSLGGA